MTNPLLPAWSGPYGGVPPFDKVKVEHFKPALEAAMAEQLAEIDRIANDPSPPTFANTIEAMERSGRMLDRVEHEELGAMRDRRGNVFVAGGAREPGERCRNRHDPAPC